MQSDFLTHTKLVPPEPRPDVLSRPRLMETLQHAIAARPLTLVSAPAGSGKTTLLSVLVATTPGYTFAWLSLDEHDNDPLLFCTGVSTVLQRAGFGAIPTPDSGTPEQLRIWLRGLINALHHHDGLPIVLVFDDLHWLDDSYIFTLLDELLEYLPARLRLLIATRHDPQLNLARLRVRRQLAELRLNALRFTVDEADALLNFTLGLDVAPAQLDQLMERTEGWAAGVSLLASSLEQIRSPTERAALFAHVQRSDRALFEFLAEEVLNRQNPFIRMFLLETAVLPALTPALCRAVTGRDDAEDVLDTLYRRNLFLTEVSASDGDTPDIDAPPVYRYHDLFRDFLRQRLRRELPEWPPRLYRRAAAAEHSPVRRIQLLLAGELYDEAGAAILAAGDDLMRTGRFGLLARYTEALPAAVREARPRLLLLQGVAKWELYELVESRALVEQALRRFTALGDGEGRAAALMQLVRNAQQSGNTAGMREVMAEMGALAQADQSLQHPRVMPLFELLVTGHWPEVLSELDQLIAVVEREHVLERRRALLEALLVYLPGPLTALPGAVSRFEHIERVLAALPPEATTEQLRTYTLGVRIYCQFWRGGWDAVVAGCQELYRLGEVMGVPAWRTIEVGALLPLCAAYRGDMVSAEAELNRLFYWVERIPEELTAQRIPYLFWRARLRWQQRRNDELRVATQRIAALEQAHGASPFLTAVQPLLRAFMAIAERRFDDAEIVLREVAAIQEQVQFSVIFGDAHVLIAYLALRRGQPERALRLLSPLLDEHERANTPGRLMWEGEPAAALLRLAVERGVNAPFAERVLQLLAPPAATGSLVLPGRVLLPDSDEALSARELEVLHVMARGASNAEIAVQLVISLHTAKRHVANILQKLGASSRTEAANRARELGLL